MNSRFLALCLAIVLYPTLVQATSVINFDENGNGQFMSISSDPQFTVSLIAAPGSDPFDMNNGLKPLIYSYPARDPSLPGFATPADGDVLLTENGSLSDIVRFFNGQIIFYSLNDGDHSLADVGLPQSRMTNSVTIPEIGEMAFYQPDFGQPGFGAGVQGQGNVDTTYIITSGAVPEPSTSAMAAAALLMGLGYWWRKRRLAARRHAP